MDTIAKKMVALVSLAIPLVLLSVIGVVFLASPHRARPEPAWLAVAPISHIPADGRPAFLPIVAPRYDAWMRVSDEIVGHVFARSDIVKNEIKVISSVHGRLAVPVDYDHQAACFVSRCFDVRFDIEGTVITNGREDWSREDGMSTVAFRTVDNVLFVRNPQR